MRKDEFRPELVEAAETELKTRRSRSKSNPPDGDRPTKVVVQEVVQNLKASSQEKEPTMGVYLAAVISFMMFPIWIVIVMLQGLGALFSDSSFLAVLAISNFFVIMVRLVVSIGIYKLKPWGYTWGLGSALLNMALMAYFSSQDGSVFFLFLTMAEAVVALAPYNNRGLFNEPEAVLKPSEIRAEPTASAEAVGNLSPEYLANLNKLSDLIKKENERFLGKSLKGEILELLDSLMNSKTDGERLLASYLAATGKNLNDELVGLSSNYSTIKEYLQKFIQYEIVEAKYLHEPKQS